jgi:hypothetical protein
MEGIAVIIAVCSMCLMASIARLCLQIYSHVCVTCRRNCCSGRLPGGAGGRGRHAGAHPPADAAGARVRAQPRRHRRPHGRARAGHGRRARVRRQRQGVCLGGPLCGPQCGRSRQVWSVCAAQRELLHLLRAHVPGLNTGACVAACGELACNFNASPRWRPVASCESAMRAHVPFVVACGLHRWHQLFRSTVVGLSTTPRRTPASALYGSEVALPDHSSMHIHGTLACAVWRRRECASIRKSQVLKAFNVGASFALPVTASCATFLVYWAQGNELQPSTVFATVGLLHILRMRYVLRKTWLMTAFIRHACL